MVEYPDELVHEAVMKMLHHDIGRLPVVDRHEPRKLVGYLGRSAIMEARLHRLHEERVREPGWLTAAIPSLVKKNRLPLFDPMTSGLKHQNNLLKINSSFPLNPLSAEFECELIFVLLMRL